MKKIVIILITLTTMVMAFDYSQYVAFHPRLRHLGLELKPGWYISPGIGVSRVITILDVQDDGDLVTNDNWYLNASLRKPFGEYNFLVNYTQEVSLSYIVSRSFQIFPKDSYRLNFGVGYNPSLNRFMIVIGQSQY